VRRRTTLGAAERCHAAGAPARLCGVPYRDLNVLDAAGRAADLVNALIDRAPPGRLLYAGQLRRAVQSVGANISEGFGRGPGPARDHALRIARGEAEEANRHLAANFSGGRIQRAEYWPPRDLLVVIVKMLTALLRR
jgi:four helix bundle protein